MIYVENFLKIIKSDPKIPKEPLISLVYHEILLSSEIFAIFKLNPAVFKVW